MRKTYSLIVTLLLLLCLISMFYPTPSDEEIACDIVEAETGVQLQWNDIELYCLTDTHGGFHGDGTCVIILKGDIANFGDGWQRISVASDGVQEYIKSQSMNWPDEFNLSYSGVVEYDWAYIIGKNKLVGNWHNATACFYDEDLRIMALYNYDF